MLPKLREAKYQCDYCINKWGQTRYKRYRIYRVRPHLII
jgi:hypothetical protein